MFDEICLKRFGDFEFYINSYKNSYKRELGLNIEKEEVHCYGCESDTLRYSLNIYIVLYSFYLEFSRCRCTNK